MSTSTRYHEWVKELGRMVWPELTEAQLDEATKVLMANRPKPGAPVDMDEIRRVGELVRRAIGDTGGVAGP